MKSLHIPVLILVLTAALLTGCGCRNYKPATGPTTMPTTATTLPTTAATTVPTTAATIPTMDGAATDPATSGTIQDGNGPMDTMETTIETGTPSRSRSFGMN